MLVGSELIFLFFLLPVILVYAPVPMMPVLFAVFVYCLVRLLMKKGFDRKLFWNAAAAKGHWRKVFGTFAVFFIVILGFQLILHPEALFMFPRRAPVQWLVVMLLYPWFSAYTQEVIYRPYFFERYKSLMPEKVLLYVNVFAFAWIHLILFNLLAFAFTLVGGYLFAKRYVESKSLFLVFVEHSLYGCFVFTIGLGLYFYGGDSGDIAFNYHPIAAWNPFK